MPAQSVTHRANLACRGFIVVLLPGMSCEPATDGKPHAVPARRAPVTLHRDSLILRVMDPKQRAAEAAIREVHSGQVVGLGTGSTADYFLRALASALRTGVLRDIRGVPTSRQSERRA